MATEVLLPKIGFSMTEATLTEWLIPNGGTVTEGQPLFAIESEKSVEEIEAPASGLLRVIKDVGEVYPVGTVLAEID
jgi:pyruvate/2-oxoglutarate dehydrogenase complex dihydrolipoamide acyltransferase (E2) component